MQTAFDKAADTPMAADSLVPAVSRAVLLLERLARQRPADVGQPPGHGAVAAAQQRARPVQHLAPSWPAAPPERRRIPHRLQFAADGTDTHHEAVMRVARALSARLGAR